MSKIIPGVVFTSETSRDFQEDWGLPTLDTQWKLITQEGGAPARVGYIFYKKKVSSRLVIPKVCNYI